MNICQFRILEPFEKEDSVVGLRGLASADEK